MRKITLLCATFALVLAAFATTAQAETITFTRYTNNGSTNIASQLTVELSFTSTGATFRFFNDVAGGTDSTLEGIWFNKDQLGGVFDFSSFSEGTNGANGDLRDSDGTGTGVEFSHESDSRPQSNIWGNGGSVGKGLHVDADPPPSSKGLDVAGEWVQVAFAFASGKDAADVRTALTTTGSSGSAIAVHVISIQPSAGVDYSDSFYSNGITIVPEPSSIALVALGLGGVLYRRRRRALIAAK